MVKGFRVLARMSLSHFTHAVCATSASTPCTTSTGLGDHAAVIKTPTPHHQQDSHTAVFSRSCSMYGTRGAVDGGRSRVSRRHRQHPSLAYPSVVADMARLIYMPRLQAAQEVPPSPTQAVRHSTHLLPSKKTGNCSVLHLRVPSSLLHTTCTQYDPALTLTSRHQHARVG